MKNQAEDLVKTLFSCMTAEELNQIAKETGFIQRKRKVTAKDFIHLILCMHGDLSTCTLQKLSTTFSMAQKMCLSRNGMDKKFTPQAVLFLQRVIEMIMMKLFIGQTTLPPECLTLPFSRFRVIDSTHVSIPEHLQEQAKQRGQFSQKIQLEVDLLSGETLLFYMTSQPLSDTKAGELRLPFIEEEELCVQDLGYFDLKTLRKIEEQQAYFLTKARADTYMAYRNPFPSYHKDGRVIQSSLYHRIDLVALTKHLKPGEYLELEGVHFGSREHFPCRCIIYRQDEAAVERRLNRIDRRTTRSQKTPKKIVRKLANITVYMTNLPPSIEAAQVVALYRLRWQIELIFKYWKSTLDLTAFKLMKKERWLCHMYGTILVAILSQWISYQLRNQLFNERRIELSEMVSMRVITEEVLPELLLPQTDEKAFKKLIEFTFILLMTTAKKSRTSEKQSIFKCL